MLHGSRVTLRAVRPEDFAKLLEFKNDVEFELAAGGLPPHPRNADDYNDFYQRFIRAPDTTSFVIEADEKVIGDCGLFNRNLTNRTTELGIGIGNHDYWGRGYGREVIELLLDYAFRLLNLRRVWLEVLSNNERGQRCYRACGFVEEGRMRQHHWSNGDYHDIVHMGVLRSEWAGPSAETAR